VLYVTVHEEFRMRRALRRVRAPRPASNSWRTGRLRNLASAGKHWLHWRVHRFRLERFREQPEASVLAAEKI